RMAIQEGLAREASTILGGDAELRFTYRFAEPDERAWMEANALQVSEVVDFRSMAVAGDGERALAQVKAVDAAYPLYGGVVLEGGGALADALAEQSGLPGLVAQRVLVARLGLAPGDTLRLGTRDFRLAGILEVEPDAAAAGF